jgi:hypothetical protein
MLCCCTHSTRGFRRFAKPVRAFSSAVPECNSSLLTARRLIEKNELIAERHCFEAWRAARLVSCAPEKIDTYAPVQRAF